MPAFMCDFTLHIANGAAPSHHSTLGFQISLPHGPKEIDLQFHRCEDCQLAYSFLPKEKNNKASSLTNLFRNQGASFAIALATMVVARRAQYHRSVLVAHATPLSAPYQQVLPNLSDYFASHGYSAADASIHTHAQFGRILDQRASFLASLDCFWLLGCSCLIGAPLVFLTRKFTSAGPGASH